MPAGDLEAALRAVERQAAAMQAVERKVAALYRRRSGPLPAMTTAGENKMPTAGNAGVQPEGYWDATRRVPILES